MLIWGPYLQRRIIDLQGIRKTGLPISSTIFHSLSRNQIPFSWRFSICCFMYLLRISFLLFLMTCQPRFLQNLTQNVHSSQTLQSNPSSSDHSMASVPWKLTSSESTAGSESACHWLTVYPARGMCHTPKRGTSFTSYVDLARSGYYYCLTDEATETHRG